MLRKKVSTFAFAYASTRYNNVIHTQSNKYFYNNSIMKTFFRVFGLSLLLIFSAASVHAQSKVTVTRLSGATYTYTVQSNGSITFSGDYVVIKESATSDETTIPMSGIRSMKFSESNAINDVTAATTPVLYPNPAQDYCIVRTAQNGPQQVTVYSMTGAKMIETTVENEGRLDISNLQAGIYMVKVNNITTKLCKW